METYAVVFVVEIVESFAAFSGLVFSSALILQLVTAFRQFRQLHPTRSLALLPVNS